MLQPIFTPTNCFGMVAWFDASRLTAGSVTTWPDSSGNGYDATAGVAPTCVAAVLNGKNIVRFNGSTTYLSTSVNLLQQMAAGTGSTIFIVSNCATVKTSSVISQYPGGFTYRCNIHLPWSDNNVYWDYGIISGSGRLSVNWGGSTGTPYVWTFNTNGTSQQNIYRNNINIATKASAEQPPFGTSCPLDIGAADRSVFYSGDIAEIIMYNRFLSAIEMSTINQYLGNKWGVVV